MTKPILFLSALVCAVAVVAFAAGTVPASKTVSFTWDYDTNSVVDAFKLYTSTNVNAPSTNWTLIGTVSSSIRAINLSNVAPAQAWYFVTASNMWGESLPSNIVGTPQPPNAVTNLRISLK